MGPRTFPPYSLINMCQDFHLTKGLILREHLPHQKSRMFSFHVEYCSSAYGLCTLPNLYTFMSYVDWFCIHLSKGWLAALLMYAIHCDKHRKIAFVSLALILNIYLVQFKTYMAVQGSIECLKLFLKYQIAMSCYYCWWPGKRSPAACTSSQH